MKFAIYCDGPNHERTRNLRLLDVAVLKGRHHLIPPADGMLPGGRLAVLTPDKAVRRLEAIPTAAEYLGVSTKTIRRYISAGRLAGYRTGPRLIRVDHAELEQLLHRIPTATGGDLHGAG